MANETQSPVIIMIAIQHARTSIDIESLPSLIETKPSCVTHLTTLNQNQKPDIHRIFEMRIRELMPASDSAESYFSKVTLAMIQWCLNES